VIASSLVGRAAQLVIYDDLLFRSRFSSSFFIIALLRYVDSSHSQLLFPIQLFSVASGNAIGFNCDVAKCCH
jgi:hypothetical protein